MLVFHMTIFLPQLEVLMKLCRQFWNQTWFCRKIQRKQLTSRTPLKISVQLYFPWKYHRYDSLHKIIFHEINQYNFFFLLEVCLHFITYRSVSRCWCYHPAEIVDKLSKQSIFMCNQMLCYVWAFYINTKVGSTPFCLMLILFLFQIDNKIPWAH